MIDIEQLKQQAIDLKLYGLQAHWHEVSETYHSSLEIWLGWEQAERKQRSLDRRLAGARLGRFKSLNEFDWQWPDKIDQQTIHRLMQLDFLTTASNIILLGSNGVGKSTIAQNLAHAAVMQGHTVLFTSAAICLTIWQRKTVIMHCGVDQNIMPDRRSYSLMKWATSPTAIAMRICCLKSLTNAMSSAQP
jgi:DNA replication protein DnaC